MARRWRRFSSNPRKGWGKYGAVWLRKKVTTNCGKKQRRDDVDVYIPFLVGQKKVPKWAERSCRKQSEGVTTMTSTIDGESTKYNITV